MLLTSALASEPARARDVYVAARVHGALGELAARVGKDSMGVEHAQAAVDMLKGRDAGDVLHARARKALCYATWKADLRDRALSECRAALEAASRSAEPRTLGLVHHTLGVMLWQLKRNEEALPHMERALSLFKQVGRDGSGLAKTHWVLGELNERVDRFREAKEHYHLSFEAFRVPYRAERASAGAGEARMLARLGKLDQARALLERLSEESNPSSPYEQAPLWETRGYIKHLQNPRDGAEEYERALDSCVASGKTVKIERLCSVSPFKHTECARLGYRNEPK
jgi:tetratricopeptide (TPR) repeat protein